ncbi:MAG: 5-formyltetrahydrofolate cyclo-ligase, partial [Mariprofundus sp.]|nr:5-formyltetrahydrofolate cyclo-ligase [Mariprofundus sp.]
MTISAQKLQIRNNLKNQRDNFINHEADTASIISRFQEYITPLLKPNEVIAAYYPNSSELNILPLLTKLSRQYFNILLPIINNKSKIDFYHWHPEDILITSKYAKNILEPKKSSPPSVPSVIIAPLLACDLNGTRVGSGKAMYDKYLTDLIRSGKKPIYIGLCYDFQLLESIESEAHDQPLDIILTNKRFI